MKILICLFLLPLGVFSSEIRDDTSYACVAYNQLPVENDQMFHGDQACDRSEYNKFKESLQRHRTHRRLKEHNEIHRVLNRKTVLCPLEVQELRKEGGRPSSLGFDSVWIVENTSKDPVVLSFVSEDGIEYSALNPSITPPQKDPEAILNPSKWRAIFAWDGHVFHARSYDSKSGNVGPVVMQHRMGLIPVGSGMQDFSCPEEDREPLVAEGVREPQFRRTPPTTYRPCNTIDIGFRNMGKCPLHAYYIGQEVNATGGVCPHERFEFHLGTNPEPDDFMWQWDSPTKFEGAFVGNSFVFRLAASPNTLVDTVTLQPTRIIDCPELKNKEQINQVTTIGELVQIALVH